jgi:acyl-CoA dehydrogenase
MKLSRTCRQREIADRARRFCDDYLLPLEPTCDAQDGLTREQLAPAKQAVLDFEPNAVNTPVEWGGQGYSMLAQVSQEQLGLATTALWDVVWRPANVLRHRDDNQRGAYLEPEIRGERRHAYAITEEHAASDPSQLRTIAVPDAGGWRISGEQWFVTVGGVADYFVLVTDAEGYGLTSFLVDKHLPGIRESRRPRYRHAFVDEHPEVVFDNVAVPDAAVLGRPGSGLALTKESFGEERILIAAGCLGGGECCLETALGYATDRHQFGSPIIGFQGVSLPLADCAVELAAARAFTYQVAWEITNQTASAKTLHANASAAKPFASQTANRIADRCLQVLGGRGYLRDCPVGRLYRDVRVDRIWEGADEIQKLIVANELVKRGRGVCDWPALAFEPA